LAGGEVLVAGGHGPYGGTLYSAEIYSPTFEDTSPPVIYAQDVVVVAPDYDATRAWVFAFIPVTDDFDPNPVVACEPPVDGRYFDVGRTPVSCTATDSWGNSSSAGFYVTVQEPLKMVFTIDAFGAIDTKTGTAVVSGTMSCSREANGFVSATITQIVASRATLTGSVYANSPCGTGPTPWSAVAVAQNGQFNPGKADVIGTGSASDMFSHTYSNAQRTIQLRSKK